MEQENDRYSEASGNCGAVVGNKRGANRLAFENGENSENGFGGEKEEAHESSPAGGVVFSERNEHER